MLKRFRIVGLCLVAVFALSAVGAVAAQASPKWIYCAKEAGLYKDSACKEATGGAFEKKVLGAGQTLAITSKSVGSFKLVTSGGNVITCTGEINTGTLYGGQPGTDRATITFTGCKGTAGLVNGCTASTSSAKPGIIGPFTVYTGLGFQGKTGQRTIVVDFFAPYGATNTFVEFKLEGSCTGTGSTVKVNATGTPEIKTVKGEAINKKCGVLPEVGKIEGGTTFKRTVSGEMAVAGGLNFKEKPTASEKEGELEEGTEFKVKTCTLEAEIKTILGTMHETAEEIGVSEVKTSPEEAFGWEL